MRKLLLLAIGLALTANNGAPAGPTVPATAANGDAAEPSIEVTGRSKQELQRFVEQLTDGSYGQQLSRWGDPICPRTIGLSSGQERFLVGRIAQIAKQLGIPADHAGCSPNIIVILQPDTDRVMRAFVRKHPAIGRDWSQGLPRPDQVARLLEPRAVRWFHASTTANARTGAYRAYSSDLHNAVLASHLKLSTKEASTLAVIILDPERISGATWNELADYIAMVGLTRPALGADFSHAPSILSLYTDHGVAATPPAGLTREDRAFLRALYESDPSSSAEQQRGMIASRIPHDRATIVTDGDDVESDTGDGSRD